MNHGMKFSKRCLALLMAAILIATNFSGLAPTARAAEDHSVTVSVGQIVANNYTLTDAEKALLESGLLTGGTFTYTAPTDSSLIRIDSDEKTITVATYTDAQGNVWVPTAAAIYVGETKKEDVTLTNGVGNYTYGENAFSVKVSYTLTTEIDVTLQETLLGAPAALKQGIVNLDAVSAQSGNLYILEQAMPELVNLANNGVDAGFTTVYLSDECAAAVMALNDQMNANGGKLNLSVMIEELENASKIQYLVENGTAMQAEVADMVEKTTLISTALTTIADNIDWLVPEYVSQETADQIKTLAAVTKNLADGMAAVNEDPWYAANHHDELLADGLTALEYSTLDTLVADLESTTALPTIRNPLTVATANVSLNMSMFDVTVKVELRVVNANNEIVTFDTKQVVLTLSEGATADEIVAAVAANGIEDSALAAWAGVYLAEHYEVSASALPGELTADTTYTITYSPKYYTVSFGYAESQSLPYGYQLELPRHEDPAQAYDYTVNGAYYVQGAIYTVVGDTTVTREAGKAYTPGQLLAIIANNYGNDKVDAILKSGALFGDEAVNVRYPDAADSSLLGLADGILSAPNYDASYENLVWVPYSYGATGVEYLFNGNTASFTDKAAKVIYRLALTNYSSAEVKAWLDLAITLSSEAEGQISALDRLSAYTETMGQLDKTKLGALNGVIDVTDLHTDPVKNEELKAYFKGIVSSIIGECLDGNQLRIYNMLLEYQAEGLIYYYQNSAAFQQELATVSGYLNGMLADEEKIAALTVLVTAAGYPEYAEKIQNIGSALATLEAELTAPNAAIDLTSDKLNDLVDALLLDQVAAYTDYGTLYLHSNVLTVTDASQKMVQLFVNGNVVDSLVFDRGYVLTEADVAALQTALDAYIANAYGTNAKYYQYVANMDLSALVGTELDQNINIEYTYTPKQFTVMIEGEAQIITIENLRINLPKSGAANILYSYLIDGVEYTTSTYTFTAEQLDRLFVNGVYTVTRTAVDMGAAKLQQIVNDLNNTLGAGSVELVTAPNGEYVGMEVNVEATEMMDFIMGLTSYAYIGMNGEGLMYLTEDASGNLMTEICLQTVINALLCDETFSSETLIALGNVGSGKLMETTLQLGNDADELIYDLDLVINLASVPSQMGTVASALERMRNYLKFYSNDGALEFELNLPDQVYGAYLIALVATGNMDKSDANAIDQQIAFQFMLDYFNAVIDSGADTTTLQNTLEMLGVELSVEEYEKYFDAFINAREDEMFTLETNNEGLTVDLNIPGNAAISRMLSLIGLGGSQMETYLGMVKENKEGGMIIASAHASLNEDRAYCAIILDVNASGLKNKYDCIRTDDIAALKEKLSSIAGYATVILLDDVVGDLTVAGTTILDLNGKTVDGTITATGNLVIVDSSMGTYDAGTVDGVSGNVTVIAGNYLTPVDDYLLNGYYMDGTTVRNAMYHIENIDGNITFVVNTDVYKSEEVSGFLPDVRAMAMDMVIDLLLNYSTTAGLAVGGNTVYDVNIVDLVDLLKSRSGEKIIDALLATVDAQGITNIANTIIADLLDFTAIYNGLASNNGYVATYDATVAPWMVAVERTAEDYLTLNIQANAELAKNFSISLQLKGSSSNYVKNLAYALSGIVEQDKTHVTVDIQQPNYDNKEFSFAASGDAFVSLDMSKNQDYAKILCVILAYANPEKAEDVAFAINYDNIFALKAVVDNTTVAELFTALKVMNRNTSFAEMAEAVGITVDTASAAELEEIYHLLLVAAGKVLEKLDITGMNAQLGNLYDEETGYYVLDKSVIERSGEVNYRGYSALYDLSVGELVFQVKLFGDTTCEHEFGEWIEQKPATCTEDGLKARVCKFCGEIEYETIPALDHSFTNYVSNNDATCTEDGTETAFCDHGCGTPHTRVEEGSALGHSFTNYVSNGDATCTENGTETAYCDHGCGETDTREAEGSALGHSFTNYISNDDATCTENATETAYCDHGCGETDTREVEGTALGHSFTNYVSNDDATCTENGTETAYCDRGCGASDTREVEDSALGHNHVVTDHQDATCTEDGYTTYTCERCGDSYTDVIPATGHTMGEWVEYLPECMCETDGERRRDCENCDYYETEVIPARGHIWLDGICQCCGAEQGPAQTGDFLIGGLAALMVAAAGGCAALIIKRKKENEEEEA